MPMTMPSTMLLGMKTTISVTGDVRDRLARLARRHGRSLGEEIAALVEAAEAAAFWDRVAEGYADMQERGLAVVMHDDYPEYAHLRVGALPAEGEHNDDAKPAARARRRA
jgi:hypothetical protein